MKLTPEQYIECYHIVFSTIHSHGFMVGEMMDLIHNDEYWFLVKPNGGWNINLREYLKSIKYEGNVEILNRYE